MPADLVFVPTPACRSAGWLLQEPLPALSRIRRTGPGQDLHLNRAMLSDQRSPYVGRFARGWPRLPRKILGQPQTRTRARPSIGTPLRRGKPPLGPSGHGPSGRRRTQGAPERPRRGDEVHLPGTCAHERPRAGGRGGAGGQDVIHQQDHRRRRPRRNERPSKRRATFRAAPACLGSRTDGSPEEARGGQVDLAPEPPGQYARLVIAARGQPRARERHPREGACIARPRGRRHGRHGTCERRPNVLPPRVLQAMDGRAGRSFESERRPRGGKRLIGAVATGLSFHHQGTSASLAPRGLQREEFRAASVAERPGTVTAPGTSSWEHDVRDPHRRQRYSAPPTCLAATWEAGRPPWRHP